MERRVDISYKTVLFISAFLGLLWVLYTIREVIILLFVALIFMSALHPVVAKLVRWRVPKVLAIVLTYIAILGVLALLVTLIVVPLSEQMSSLSRNLPHALDSMLPPEINRSVLQNQIGDITKNVLGLTLLIVNNIVGVISVFVVTFYLLLERDNLESYILQFFAQSEPKQKKAKAMINVVSDKLGAWVRGQLFLSFTIGVTVYLVLGLINLVYPPGIPYTIPLAILAGILEVVPTIGPIVAALPALALAYTVSPILVGVVAASYFLIQQLENHYLVPQVMKKAVGLNPLLVILAVAAGSQLLGIAGALLAVPFSVAVQEIVRELVKGD